jgi:signal transduction histidine kinase
MEDRAIEALEKSIERLRREVAELRASRTRLVLAADAHRREIERELHDGAQQDLVGLAVNLQQVRRLVTTDPAAAGALVDEMRRDVHEGLDRLRALAERIYPPQLEAGGLRVALRTAAANAGVRARVEVAVGGACPAELAVTVYLCWVEALERIGDGASATIAVRDEDETLVFEISADVAGLDTVKDRVEALGGCLTIASGRVAGSLPLSR